MGNLKGLDQKFIYTQCKLGGGARWRRLLSRAVSSPVPSGDVLAVAAVDVPLLLAWACHSAYGLEFRSVGVRHDAGDHRGQAVTSVGVHLAPVALLAGESQPERRVAVADVERVDALDRLDLTQ